MSDLEMAVQIFYKIDLGYVLLQSFAILFRKSWERKWWFQIILDTNILTKVGRAREYDLGFKVRKTIFVQPTAEIRRNFMNRLKILITILIIRNVIENKM